MTTSERLANGRASVFYIACEVEFKDGQIVDVSLADGFEYVGVEDTAEDGTKEIAIACFPSGEGDEARRALIKRLSNPKD